MACYHPMYGKRVFENGSWRYKIISTWEGSPLAPGDIPLPCGQCIGCRLDKSRTWADRMMLELDHSKTAVFITLTYSDEFVPLGMEMPNGNWTYSLDKRSFQKFMKRLRWHFSGREIRFYACGEYGSTTGRPHYHAIIFGLSLFDFPDILPIGKNDLRQTYYKSDLLQSIWSFGHVSLAPVSWSTCAYVSRYVTKKLTGDAAIEYSFLNIEPEFAVMSRRPGIAGYFASDHPELLSEPYLYLNDIDPSSSKNKVRTPKYLFDKLEFINPELYNSVKAERKCLHVDSTLLELHNSDLGYSEYLASKECNTLDRIKKLKRSL